jgi:hypothetical protein
MGRGKATVIEEHHPQMAAQFLGEYAGFWLHFSCSEQ